MLMFNNNKILVVIPARGGSKGIPRKNIRLLNNRPLISYSIGVARASKYVDDVVVTTDDSENLELALSGVLQNCPVMKFPSLRLFTMQ